MFDGEQNQNSWTEPNKTADAVRNLQIFKFMKRFSLSNSSSLHVILNPLIFLKLNETTPSLEIGGSLSHRVKGFVEKLSKRKW